MDPFTAGPRSVTLRPSERFRQEAVAKTGKFLWGEVGPEGRISGVAGLSHTCG